jgi:hypothetical protein
MRGGINGPGNVLLDGHRESRTQSPFDAVGKLAFVRVAIVCVKNRLVVIQKIESRLLSEECGRHENAYS